VTDVNTWAHVVKRGAERVENKEKDERETATLSNQNEREEEGEERRPSDRDKDRRTHEELMALGDLESSTTAAINPYVEDAHSSEVGCGMDTKRRKEDAAEPGERDMEQN
jgi:hypothetical protein